MKRKIKIDMLNHFLNESILIFSCSVQNYLEKSALAKAKRILQPPENVLVALTCISEENPRPFNIIDALAGAFSASICSNCA